MIQKAIKYRLYPNQEQKNRLDQMFGASRFIWNYFLAHRKEKYLNFTEGKLTKEQSSSTYCKDSKALTNLKKTEEFSWLSEGSSQALQQTLRDLEGSYAKFFRKQNKFPKFKSKKTSRNSFRVTNHSLSLKDNRIQITKFKEGIKIKKHKEIEGRLINATISKNPSGRYFVSVLYETAQKKLPKKGKKIGCDLGIKDLIICSDGTKYKNIRPLKTLENKLHFKQKQLSKKKRGSENKNKSRIKVAQIHEKITNTRQYYLHKITTEIVRKSSIIAMENLNVKGMMKNHCLSKAISDVAWGEIVSQLEYKSDWYGRKFIQIDRFFPSSKTCNKCQYINENLTLSTREWTCPKCKTVLDRDINAGRNILAQGLNLLNAGRNSV